MKNDPKSFRKHSNIKYRHFPRFRLPFNLRNATTHLIWAANPRQFSSAIQGTQFIYFALKPKAWKCLLTVSNAGWLHWTYFSDWIKSTFISSPVGYQANFAAFFVCRCISWNDRLLSVFIKQKVLRYCPFATWLLWWPQLFMRLSRSCLWGSL